MTTCSEQNQRDRKGEVGKGVMNYDVELKHGSHFFGLTKFPNFFPVFFPFFSIYLMFCFLTENVIHLANNTQFI